MADVATADVRVIDRDAVAQWLPAVAELRIAVFREFPYLYEGDLAYERGYLQRYATSPGAVLVGAFVDGALVGASTGVPLVDEPDEVIAPFVRHGDDLAQWFYFGESVLARGRRGHGIGAALFEARRDHARRLGFARTCFCRVVRPPDHPLRPADHRDLDPFWRSRGYAPLPGYTASMSWREVGEAHESPKAMEMWGEVTP